MEDKQIYDQIKKHSKNLQISCKQCFDIAGELNIGLKSIGAACNKMKIRIRSCQLGCFK